MRKIWNLFLVLVCGAFSFFIFPSSSSADTKAACLGFNECLEKAEKGDSASQFLLAFKYYDKGEEKKHDIKKAVEWYEKSANQGYAFSQMRLGKMYLEGLGVAIDGQKAIHYFRMGAEKGDPIMQTYLGGMYGLGAGGIIPIDMVESYAWYMAAQYQGIKGNGKLRETYQAAMGSETFAKAEKKAKQYQDAYSKPFPEFRNR